MQARDDVCIGAMAYSHASCGGLKPFEFPPQICDYTAASFD